MIVLPIHLQDESGRVVGAEVEDCLTGNTTTVHARAVINATGPFADHIRRLDDPEAKDAIMPSSGKLACLSDSLTACSDINLSDCPTG